MDNPFEIILEKLNRIEKEIEKLKTDSNDDDDDFILDNKFPILLA